MYTLIRYQQITQNEVYAINFDVTNRVILLGIKQVYINFVLRAITSMLQ